MKEKTISAISGYPILFALIVALGTTIYFIEPIVHSMPLMLIPLMLIILFSFFGFLIVNPNQSRVLTFFGKYVGTVRDNGFHWVNPLYRKRKISLRARNFGSMLNRVGN